MNYLLIGFAGILGAIVRYLIGISFFTNSPFPFATLFINLTGSFLLAWLTSNLSKKFSLSPLLVTTIGTGFIGSFTTFSTMSVETVTLFKNGELLLGFLYIFASIFGGLLMSRLGFKVSEEVQNS